MCVMYISRKVKVVLSLKFGGLLVYYYFIASEDSIYTLVDTNIERHGKRFKISNFWTPMKEQQNATPFLVLLFL